MNSEAQVKVWDPAVRVFHWSLAASFVIAYFLVEDDWLSLHVWAGYAVLALVLFRILWGLAGTRHARFTDFVYRPATVVSHLKDLARLSTRRYLGHNPAGGAMTIALLASLLATVLTGLAVYGADQHAGPLAGLMRGAGEEAFEEVHELFANLTLVLVSFHIAGVVIESLLHGENLVRSMVTGRKRAS